MKAVQIGDPERNIWTVEVEEGDLTGCPDWCDTNHVGEHLTAGEAITHQRTVEYRLSYAPQATDDQKKGDGEGAFIHLHQYGNEPTTLHVCDSLGESLIDNLSPIGAWSLAFALREAALRAYPFIQMHDDDSAEFAYKAPQPWHGTPAAKPQPVAAPKVVRAA